MSIAMLKIRHFYLYSHLQRVLFTRTQEVKYSGPPRTGKALVALALTASLVTGQATTPAPAEAQQFPAFQMPALPQFNEEQVQQAAH